MILGYQGDYIIFKTESYYFNNIQLNVHNRDSFFILFFHINATAIAKFENL